MLKEKSQLKFLLVIQGFWFFTVCLLAGWWMWLLQKQSSRILELESRFGVSDPTFHALKNFRMIFWESAAFFSLLVVFTVMLGWLYYRELKRYKSLQAFFAALTHELKTPLSSIRLQAETVLDRLAPEDRSHELVSRLLQDSSRLELEVERLLELARIEGGGKLFKQKLNIKNLIQSTLEKWKASQPLAASISVDIQQVHNQTIHADALAFQVVLRNLLENSTKHAQQKNLKIQLRSLVQDQWVRLEYMDNGKKVSANPEKLGQLFYRGDFSKGAGVGLYLVRSLMNRMEGKASFIAEAGLKTALWFKRDGENHASSS